MEDRRSGYASGAGWPYSPEPPSGPAANSWPPPEPCRTTPTFEHPGARDPEVRQRRHPEHQPVWWLLFATIGVLNLGTLAVYADHSTIVGAALLSLIPFLILMMTGAAVQTKRPEPVTTRGWAVFWGACVAATVAGVVNTFASFQDTELAVVYTAPISEELMKGLGLVILVLWKRIRNGLDGVVYALYVAAGFALLENIFYLTDAINLDLSGRTEGLTSTTFLTRGLTTPYAHPLFTMVFGAALGAFAARSGITRLFGAALALFGAISLHGIWNYFAYHQHGQALSLVFAPMTAIVALTVGVAVARERRAVDRGRPLVGDATRQLIDVTPRERRRGYGRLGAGRRLEHELAVRDAYRTAAAARWCDYPPDPDTRASTPSPTPQSPYHPWY